LSHRADNTSIMSMSALDSLVDLLRDESVQEKMDEVGRLFFSNDSVTINLYWAAAAALLTLLLLIPLLSLLFQPAAAVGGSGYGAPSVAYGAPEESYGAPAPAYGAPGYSRSDSDIYGEARSLYNEITSSGESTPLVADITKRLGEVGPVMSALGNAAAKLLE